MDSVFEHRILALIPALTVQSLALVFRHNRAYITCADLAFKLRLSKKLVMDSPALGFLAAGSFCIPKPTGIRYLVQKI